MEQRNSSLEITIQGPSLKYMSLENGARCVLAPIEEATLTCLDFWCKAGSANEEFMEEGLAHFLEHMVFKGSKSLKAGEFDRKIESLGGSTNAATGFDDVHFYVLVPPQEVGSALDLLMDLVLNPSIDDKHYGMEREVVLEEIAQYKDQPEEQAIQKLFENVWPKHAYGRPILGFEKTLRQSTPIAMKRFHRRLYHIDNFFLAIAGRIPDNITELLEDSPLSKITNKQSYKSCRKEIKKPRFRVGHKELILPRLESARLLMAWEMPCANNQRMVMGADLGTTILAEGRRSRLVQLLREDLKIVESVDMDITTLEESGLIVLEACCQEDNLSEVEYKINKELKNSLYSRITKEELKRAKELVKNSLCFGIETPSQVAYLSSSNALWGREQELLAPLNHLNYWEELNLKEEFFKLIQPNLSFTILAKSGKG